MAGFYGSIYYQITNAFAKILIGNKGKTNNTFAQKDNIITDEISLEADGRNGTASFTTGNKWIQLEGNAADNKCTIWHAPADEENATSFVVPFQRVNSPTSAMLENAESLEGGSCFQTPVIYYDDAGHLTSSGYTKYFTIPKTDYEQNLDTMQQNIKDLQQDVQDQNTDIQTLKNNINTHNVQIQNLTSTTNKMQTFMGNQKTYTDATGYSTLTQGIQDISSQITNNNEAISFLTGYLNDIKARIEKLEAQQG